MGGEVAYEGKTSLCMFLTFTNYPCYVSIWDEPENVVPLCCLPLRGRGAQTEKEDKREAAWMWVEEAKSLLPPPPTEGGE